jgi:SAM-dependent methyltransferase
MLGKSPEVVTIIDFVTLLKPAEVLEVGCNFGRELKYLEGLSKLYGIDKDLVKIGKAKEYVSGTFKVADAADIPFKSNRFDLVYVSGVLAHNPKVDLYLEESLRVSKKYLLIVEYVGTHSSRTTVGNCKQNTWVHDYNFLVSKLNANVKYNQVKTFGADCFHVLLLEKKVPETVVINEFQESPKQKKFVLKIGKFELGVM